jgi:hypothetical protein
MLVLVLEDGDEGLHGQGVADPAERPGGSLACGLVLVIAERLDQPVDVSLGLEARDVGWSEQ